MKPVQPRNFGQRTEEASDAVAVRRPHLFDGDYTERSTPRASTAEVAQLRGVVAALKEEVLRLAARVRVLERG